MVTSQRTCILSVYYRILTSLGCALVGHTQEYDKCNCVGNDLDSSHNSTIKDRMPRNGLLFAARFFGLP